MSSGMGKSIQKLLDFVQIYGRVEGFNPPGYATAALGLSYDYISRNVDNVSFDASSQTLKLKFPLADLPLQAPPSGLVLTDTDSPSLSTYLAMMDDITTWALVLADNQRGRAGKTVTFQAAWNPTYRDKINHTTDTVEFTAQVQKIRQNVGFVQAHVHDVTSKQLVCFGSQVKFMPMGTVMDAALSSRGWECTKLYSHNILSRNDETKTAVAPLNVYQSFQLVPTNDSGIVAQFTPSREHASLGGPIHGGCQAVLMELAGMVYCAQSLDSADTSVNRPSPLFRLDSTTIEYMSGPKAKVVSLKVIPVTTSSSTVALRVQLLDGDNAKTKVQSQGLLHFSKQTYTISE